MRRRNRIFVLIAVSALAIAAVPAVVLAAGGTFTDDDTSIFEADIEWLAGADVTKGCNPPTNDKFCPDDNVTRGQMAAFMKRFAGFLGAEDGVVNSADSAGNADTVDGKHATGFLGKTEKAADSNLLDGYDWSAFLSYDSDIPALQTMTGVYATTAPSGSYGTAAISLFPKLRADIPAANTHYLSSSAAYTTQCPGPGEALAGHFCVYEAWNGDMTFLNFYPPGAGVTDIVYEEGTVLLFSSTGALGNVRGTWAVTAPLVFIP